MKRIPSVFLLIVVACAGRTLAANQPGRTASRDGRRVQLGSVNFQTSCSAQVQQTMNQAVALLHSFQYQQAEAAFGDVAQRDPHCAMAEWGNAMSLYHQLWDFPDADTLAKGRADVDRAQKLNAKTQTERDYIAAAAAFFQDKPGLTQQARVAAYVQAMEAVYKDSPQDPDAAGFYALAFVNLAGYQDEIGNLKKAIAILQPMFSKYPNNPGLAHYLIHASDTPELAPQGLVAARAYAKIAPDSSHALHMPSHIFTRLGLWQESIDSNIAAAASARKATLAHQADFGYQTHAMDFLNYAYLQSGQDAKARQVVADLKNVPGATSDDIAEMEAEFVARDALETHQWKEAAALSVPKVKLSYLDTTYFVRAMGEARLGDPQAARADVAKLEETVNAQRSEAHKMGYTTASGPSIVQREADAWIDFAEGKTDAALRTLRAVADDQDAAGPGPLGPPKAPVSLLAMPAREMLGDMLLAAKQPNDALAAYRIALKESPNRFDGLWGAAQAADAAGNSTAAREYYAKLLSICGSAADRPELAQARAYVNKVTARAQ